MNSVRIGIAILITVVLFGLYSWWSTRNYDGFEVLATGQAYRPDSQQANENVNSQQYSAAEVEMPPLEASPNRVVAPSGPNAPNQLPGPGLVVMPEEVPYDPQAQPYESAEIPERLRHPERMFGPGLVNDQTLTAIASDIASSSVQATDAASQAFSPEMAQNGGLFMGTIAAYDADMPTSYSSV
jgi:hypothetical protein